MVLNEAELNVYATAFRTARAADEPMLTDLNAGRGAGDPRSSTIPRLRRSLPESLIGGNDVKEARLQTAIPVLIQRNNNLLRWHKERLVLFLDNHVEYVRYGSRFPVSEEAFHILDGLATR